MKRKAALFLLAVLLSAVGCGSGSTAEDAGTTKNVEGLDELGSITVISREEGSGTRSTFAALLGFDTADSESGKADQCRDDAQISESGEAVIQAVKEESAAIGYISMGAAGENAGVHSLLIDGTEGTSETVEKGIYPLSRSFYLAWSGTPDDLEQDFLTYVEGKGQEVVQDGYVAVGKSETFLSLKPSGTITIQGSTSVAPLMENLAAAYEEINQNASVEVTATDSSDGLTAAMEGQCSFGMASRELETYEKELLDYVLIAKDGIAVIVNDDNPLKDIGTEVLKEIYTGEIDNWEELNS